MPYDPETYWHNRGKDYRVALDTTPGIDFLLDSVAMMLGHVEQAVKILEVGPGYGRILSAFKKKVVLSRGLFKAGVQFSTCDFVESMRVECRRRTGVLPAAWDGDALPYPDDAFDLVISFSVALHVPPEKIRRFLDEHLRVAKTFLFVATVIDSVDPLASHCFIHDAEYIRMLQLFPPVDMRVFRYGNATHSDWMFDVSAKNQKGDAGKWLQTGM